MNLFRPLLPLSLCTLLVLANASAEPADYRDWGTSVLSAEQERGEHTLIHARSEHGNDHHKGNEHAQEEGHTDDTKHHEGKEHHEEMGHHEGVDHHDSSGNLTDYIADYSFTLKAKLIDGKMVYTGVGGEIDGLQNPVLEVDQNAVVEITLVNASVLEHDLVIPDLNAHSEHVPAEGDTTSFAFKASQPGELSYYCSVPGHKEAGMVGSLQVSEMP